MPVLSVKIVLDCFCLLIFYPEKNSTDVCRLPYAVNVNLIFSLMCLYQQTTTLRVHHVILYISLPSFHRYDMKLTNFTSSLYGVGEHNTKISPRFAKLNEME